MACTVSLAGITYDCTDLGIGGITRLSLVSKSAVDGTAGLTLDKDNRTVTAAAAVTGVVDYTFNLKDGFSAFNEVKTVNADGTSTTVPTITVEFPKMSAANITELNEVATPGAELVAFIETAAGTYHLVGADYGLYASTVDMSSGAARSEKNRIQLTLTGEENGLAYSIADVDDFNTIIA
jgi:hypothetical protein